VETLAKPWKHSIMSSDVEKVAKSGEKWGKLWIRLVIASSRDTRG
jgi:hypothetical protein